MITQNIHIVVFLISLCGTKCLNLKNELCTKLTEL